MKSLKFTIAVLAITSLSSFTNPVKDETKDPEKKETTATSASSSTVEYRIQLGAFDGEAPENMLEILAELEGVEVVKSKGKNAYLTASYSSEAEASAQLPILRDKGFKSAMKVVILEDYVVPARTYHFFYDQKNVSAAEKTKLFETQIVVKD